MNPLTSEWIEKAEGDLLTAEREYRARNRPNYDAVCFHAQQTAEKYLKAWLQEADKAISTSTVWSTWFRSALRLILPTRFSSQN